VLIGREYTEWAGLLQPVRRRIEDPPPLKLRTAGDDEDEDDEGLETFVLVPLGVFAAFA
jgi:hypothetical protein